MHKRLRLFSRCLLTAGVLSLSACGSVFDDEGQKRVRYTLKDPGSAEFRGARSGRSASEPDWAIFCGEVNAKNSYGALGGFSRYVVVDSVVIMEDDVSIASSDPGESLSGKLVLIALQTKAESEVLRARLRASGLGQDPGSIQPPRLVDFAWDSFCR